MVLLLDLAEALNQLRLLLLVTGRCALVIELFELPLELFELRLKYDLVQALNELRLLLLVTGRCYLVLELFELRLKYDLGRIAKIVAVRTKKSFQSNPEDGEKTQRFFNSSLDRQTSRGCRAQTSAESVTWCCFSTSFRRLMSFDFSSLSLVAAIWSLSFLSSRS